MPDIDDEKLKEEINKLHTAVYEKFGYEMKYVRPPKGEYSELSLKYITNLGYIPVMWSFAYAENPLGVFRFAQLFRRLL